MLITCTGCQGPLNVPDSAVGKNVRCPRCQHVLTVQAAPTLAVSTATPLATSKPAPAPPAPASDWDFSESAPGAGFDTAPAEAFDFNEGKRRLAPPRASAKEDLDFHEDNDLTRIAANSRGSQAAGWMKAAAWACLLGAILLGGVTAKLLSDRLLVGGILAVLLGFLVVAIIFNFFAAAKMRRFSGTGLIWTAAILSFVAAAVNLVIPMVLMLGGRLPNLFLLAVLLGNATALLVSGIVAILFLQSPHVRAMVEAARED